MHPHLPLPLAPVQNQIPVSFRCFIPPRAQGVDVHGAVSEQTNERFLLIDQSKQVDGGDG